MSTTFVLTLIVFVIVVAYWRVALVILLATLLALLLAGVNTVAQALDRQPEPPVVVAPAEPGPPLHDPGQQSDNDPRTPSEPQN